MVRRGCNVTSISGQRMCWGDREMEPSFSPLTLFQDLRVGAAWKSKAAG